MGETEAEGVGAGSDLRHDKHTVSLLTDHLVFSPKYRGKVLLGEVAEAAEEIIRETCREFDIEVIDEENEKALKTGYITLYAKLFVEAVHLKNEISEKTEKLIIPLTNSQNSLTRGIYMRTMFGYTTKLEGYTK